MQYALVIARVCGFARGAAESKKLQTSVITGVYCTSIVAIAPTRVCRLLLQVYVIATEKCISSYLSHTY